ncbi:30324_t:CDS:2 [Racocetra persica]|uniref:30324_t:CDS:1 n=1 Tax=Racocetra persica TaxID=160502 RepID=A0ACA9KF36_9GLOM|nr:30324_t:CDS:2 [Racocetra persica]
MGRHIYSLTHLRRWLNRLNVSENQTLPKITIDASTGTPRKLFKFSKLDEIKDDSFVSKKARSFPSALLAFYNEQLYTHPLRTKAITAGILTGLQEFLAQEFKGCQNGIICGPLGHVLFEISNKIFKNRAGGGTKILQILVTLLIILPTQHIVYLAAMAIIAGLRTTEQIQASIKKSLWPMVRTTWIVFPIVQTFAQKFLEPQLWVPFFNLVGFSLGLHASTKAKIRQQRKLAEDDDDQ